MATLKRPKSRRSAVAAVEFAVCAPLIVWLLLGLWEVGRMVEVQNVMWNSAREAARDASVGQASLNTVATNLLAYLQGAEPIGFGQGHTTTMKAPTVSLPSGTTGLMCFDSTANKELFTITFADLTTTSVTDPTGMSQLDRYRIGVQVPYSTIGWMSLAKITGTQRLYVSVDWVSMVDAPFQITPSLPAQ